EGLVWRLCPSMSEGAVQGLAYSGSFEDGRFVDRYYTLLAPQMADAVAANVRPVMAEPQGLALVEPGAAETNLVHFAQPGAAIDALMTARSSRVDVGVS